MLVRQLAGLAEVVARTRRHARSVKCVETSMNCVWRVNPALLKKMTTICGLRCRGSSLFGRWHVAWPLPFKQSAGFKVHINS
jgi:hypothetical protein